MTSISVAPPPAGADSVLPPVDQKNLRRAAWAGGIGTALENFDFTIFGTASAIIFSKIFFSSLDPASGMLASFGVLFIGFGARPLGGMFFSKYGDRLGRKFVMVATLFLMGTATFVIGLLPTYAQVGIWSPILLLMVRFLQGFGAGAEQASGIVLLTETAPKGKRGRYASLVFVGAAAGAAMGAIVWILVQMMPKEALLSYGWRLVFFSSIFVTFAAYVIRRKVSESPVFEELKVEGIVKKEVSPVGDVWKHGKKHLARIFFMNIGANAHSYIFQVFIGGYLITWMHIDAKLIPKFLLIGALCACVSAVVFGILSDKYGRKRMYLIVTGFLALYSFPAFMLMSTGNLVLICLVIVVGFNGLSIFGAPSWAQQVFSGGILIVAVGLSTLSRRILKAS